MANMISMQDSPSVIKEKIALLTAQLDTMWSKQPDLHRPEELEGEGDSDVWTTDEEVSIYEAAQKRLKEATNKNIKLFSLGDAELKKELEVIDDEISDYMETDEHLGVRSAYVV